MVLARMIAAHEEDCAAAHVKGAAHRKVTFKVFEVSDLKVQASNPNAKMWYTIKATSDLGVKAQPMGKVESKRVTCSNGQFDSAHEMLVDIDMVQSLTLKVKYSSSILGRKMVAGSYTFNLHSAENSNASIMESTVKLQDSNGNSVGSARVCIMVSKTAFPSLHYVAEPFWKSASDAMSRPYSPLQQESCVRASTDCVNISYFQGHKASFRVQGSQERFTCVEQDHGVWKISEKQYREAAHRPARKFTLESFTADASAPMTFSLHQTAGSTKHCSTLKLMAGNTFDVPTDASARWGVWTLVREHKQEEDDKAEVEFLALIHIVGPSVETRSNKEAALALAIGNAMFWACHKHDAALQRVHELVHQVFHMPKAEKEGALGSAEHGRGFFALGHSDAGLEGQKDGAYSTKWMELRMKLSGVGSCLQSEERCIAAFLRGQSALSTEGLLLSGALVASDLGAGAGGSTVLGLPFF